MSDARERMNANNGAGWKKLYEARKASRNMGGAPIGNKNAAGHGAPLGNKNGLKIFNPEIKCLTQDGLASSPHECTRCKKQFTIKASAVAHWNKKHGDK